ncbi:hypothetical protein HYALB_00007607 [Hymenoscyphus albidus]|uniref:Uncharacterized protein n=1 Tax=Hymenoscyphus albidus TaxID=595503 RepID=A0A9N9LGE6_9HELO|nr:hypothetical protein HYALB_00007607 [Hymenoscyphus albidus]
MPRSRVYEAELRVKYDTLAIKYNKLAVEHDNNVNELIQLREELASNEKHGSGFKTTEDQKTIDELNTQLSEANVIWASGKMPDTVQNRFDNLSLQIKLLKEYLQSEKNMHKSFRQKQLHRMTEIEVEKNEMEEERDGARQELKTICETVNPQAAKDSEVTRLRSEAAELKSDYQGMITKADWEKEKAELQETIAKQKKTITSLKFFTSEHHMGCIDPLSRVKWVEMEMSSTAKDKEIQSLKEELKKSEDSRVETG